VTQFPAFSRKAGRHASGGVSLNPLTVFVVTPHPAPLAERLAGFFAFYAKKVESRLKLIGRMVSFCKAWQAGLLCTMAFAIPWKITDTGSAFRITDADGIALAYVYYKHAAGMDTYLTKADAQEMAVRIARLSKPDPQTR
jgi:hypothetical protein